MLNHTIASEQHNPSGLTDLQKQAAYYAMRLGCEAFPVIGKKPALAYKWRENAIGYPGLHEATESHWQAATGFALTPCQGSTLAILDIDDPDHPKAKALAHLILGTFTVKRGHHIHAYLRLAWPLTQSAHSIQRVDLSGPKPVRHEVLSLRGAGAYVVGPGSKHESGDVYTVIDERWNPAQLDEQYTRQLLDAFGTDWREARDTAIQRFKERKSGSPKPAFSKINPTLLDEIIRRLESHEGRSLEFSPAGTASLYRNPIRGEDDKNRSSFFSRVTGWIHDRAGESWNAARVCDFLGIHMNDFGGLYPQQPAAMPEIPGRRPADTRLDLPAERLNYWPGGIPDYVRELLLKIDNQTGLSDQCPALMVWEIFNHAVLSKCIEPTARLSVRDLTLIAERINWHTTRWTLEKGVQQLAAWGILRECGDESRDMGGDNLSETQQNPGRPPKVYRFRKLRAALISIREIVRFRVREWFFRDVADIPDPAWFGRDEIAAWKTEQIKARDGESMRVDDLARRERAAQRYEKAMKTRESMLHVPTLLQSESTPLPTDKHYPNVIAYRDNLYLGKVRANPGRQISREKAAAEIGRSASALAAAAGRAGIIRTAEYKIFELQPGAPIMAQIRELASWAVNHPGAAIVATDANSTPEEPIAGTHLDAPDLDEWAARHFQHGRRVFLRVQVASRESEAGADEHPQKPEKRRGSGNSSTSEGVVTVWRGFSPLFVARQLELRGLEDRGDHLLDVRTGEILYPPQFQAVPVT